MKVNTALLVALASCSSLALVGCNHESNSTEKTTISSPPPLNDTQTSDDIKPPSANQISTMDVKTQSMKSEQPIKPETSQEAMSVKTPEALEQLPTVVPELEKAEPEKTAIDNEPKTPEKSGEQIYATCAACHGDHGQGAIGPKLKGQKESNLEAKLLNFKDGKTAGALSAMMIPNAQLLSEADIKAVAHYIASF